jgi:hypothetical protein
MLVADDAGLNVEAPVCVDPATVVGELRVTEEALVRWVVDDTALIVERPTKDAECIEICTLAPIVEPEDPVAVGKPGRHVGANDVVIASHLRDHVIGDEHNDIPVPVDLVHVRIAGLDLVGIGTIEDPRPRTRSQELLELGRVFHGRIIDVTGDSNPEEFRVGCETNVGSEGFENASGTAPRGALEKNPHTL